MNFLDSMDSRQRKLTYAVGMLILFAPIYVLGRPSEGKPGTGGQLAQMRDEYQLGEATLGEVDPASSTMNLVLLGMRGVATNYLWMEAEELKKTKNWSQLESVVNSITLLQPHFRTVWEYQAWNLGFNVSAEFDAVEDRYYWVKRGMKYIMRGTRINQQVPEMFFYTGEFAGHKMGRSDEKDKFRVFFRDKDPDEEKYKGGVDEDINPPVDNDGNQLKPYERDNYMVARRWFKEANKLVEKGFEQHRMDLPLFIAYPHRSLMEFASARQDEGVFDEIVHKSWEQGYREWVSEYGITPIPTTIAGKIILEGQEEILRQFIAEELPTWPNMTLEIKKAWVNRYQDTCGYRFWRSRCLVESRDDLLEARKELFQGKKEYRDNQNMQLTAKLMSSGLKKLGDVLLDPQYLDLNKPIGAEETKKDEPRESRVARDDNDLSELAFKSIIIWQAALDNLGEKLPEDFPLKKELWDSEKFKTQKEDLLHKFELWQGSSSGDTNKADGKSPQ